MSDLIVGPLPHTAQWMAERQNHIGASEAAAACGVSPYAQPLEIYLRKRGEIGEIAENAAMRMGKRLEPVVIEEVGDRLGRPICVTIPMAWRAGTEHIAATPDGLVDVDWHRPVEVKTTSWRRAHEWGDGPDDVPVDYLLQVQQQMYVCGADVCELGVLIDGSTFRHYSVPRHDGLIARIVEAETELWQRIQDGRPPEPNWTHPRTTELVRDMHGLQHGLSVDLGYEVAAIVDEWAVAKADEKDARERSESLKARLLHAMGDAELGCLPDGAMLVRKTVSRAGYDVKPATFVTLTHKQPRKK